MSVLAHLTLLAALVLILPRPSETEETEPSYELVFDDGSAPAPSTADTPGERPNAEAPTAVSNAPIAPQFTAPVAEEPPAPVPTPPALPDPAPAVSEPTTPVSPAVRLEIPPELPPDTPRPPDFMPPVPLPQPPLSIPRISRPPRPVQQAQRRTEFGSFAAPLDLNFGPLASRLSLPRGSRAVDLSLGAPKLGPNRAEAFFDARAARIGADWANGLEAYWLRHRHYPSQALQNGEDGTVRVEIVVNRLGKVEQVQVVGRSGSQWLDMAALATWRGAQLAPFPPESQDQRTTLTLTINYILIR